MSVNFRYNPQQALEQHLSRLESGEKGTELIKIIKDDLRTFDHNVKIGKITEQHLIELADKVRICFGKAEGKIIHLSTKQMKIAASLATIGLMTQFPMILLAGGGIGLTCALVENKKIPSIPTVNSVLEKINTLDRPILYAATTFLALTVALDFLDIADAENFIPSSLVILTIIGITLNLILSKNQQTESPADIVTSDVAQPNEERKLPAEFGLFFDQWYNETLNQIQSKITPVQPSI